MTIYLKRYLIKIPSDITISYCDKKQVLLIKGPLGKKLLKLQTKIEIFEQRNILYVTNSSFEKLSNNVKKNIKILRGTIVALIKQIFLEVSTVLHKKLNFVGVGYKNFVLDDKIMHFKLGYSHDLFFKIPTSVSIQSRKTTKVFISSNKYNYVSQIAALIRSYKTPEPYKGKGILYSNEIIKLKEGKKI